MEETVTKQLKDIIEFLEKDKIEFKLHQIKYIEACLKTCYVNGALDVFRKTKQKN